MTPSRQPPHALFVQATDPAAYPPLMHAAGILAESGWTVTFLSAPVVDKALVLPSHPAIHEVRITERPSHVMGRGHFLEYCRAAARLARCARPSVIYVSDPMGAAPGLLASATSGARLVYHEHDTPTPGERLNPLVAWTRRQAMRRAAQVVFPNAERAAIARASTGFDPARLHIVWNAPRQAETPCLQEKPDEPLVLYYHGSITPDRLPESVAAAVAHFAGRVRLEIAGYESPGATGHVARLQAVAGEARGLPLVRYAGRIPAHDELLRHAAQAHVGLALMPPDSDDVNMRHMTGASNKAFDYLSAGLALLVSDLPDWREMFVTPGYATTCDPRSVDSLTAAIQWFLDHPAERRRMAMAGRARIGEDWNYERQFAPVLRALGSMG